MRLNSREFYEFLIKELFRFKSTFKIIEQEGVCYVSTDMGFSFAYSKNTLDYLVIIIDGERLLITYGSNM